MVWSMTGRDDKEPQADGADSNESRRIKKPKPVAQTPGEVGGPEGPEPTRYGDWERNGRVSDF